MPRFTFIDPDDPERRKRSVFTGDEATARAFIAAQTTHPDPDGEGDGWTPEQMRAARARMDAAAARLIRV